MFENLSDKLQRSFKTLRGEGTITDENISMESRKEEKESIVDEETMQLRKTLHKGQDDDFENRHASILKRQHV